MYYTVELDSNQYDYYKFLTPTVHTQQGDMRLLDGAVLAAGASPLGKAHPLVLHGKQMKEALVKERARLEFEMREAAHVRIRAHILEREHIKTTHYS